MWRYVSVHSATSLSGFGWIRHGPPLRLTPAHDQPGALEHAQVLGDGRHAHVERLGELGDRALARSPTAPESRGASGRRVAANVVLS
jgi:hypothetical protein